MKFCRGQIHCFMLLLLHDCVVVNSMIIIIILFKSGNMAHKHKQKTEKIVTFCVHR